MPLQDNLYRLFILDQQVRGLSSRLDAATRRQKATQRKLDELQQQHDEIKDQLLHAKADADASEVTSKSMSDKVAKFREQMNTVKNNKEYAALLVEVNTLKVEQGKAETAALESLGKADDLKTKLEEAAEKIANQTKIVEGAATEVAAAREEVGDRLDKVSKERDAAAAEVPEPTLKEFNRLATAYDGEAMAPVIEQDRKRHEYACGGCFMQFPMEKMNTLITRLDSVTTCTTCGRMLYLDAKYRDSLVTK